MNHSSELKISEELYSIRRDRLERLLKLDAPRIILLAECELFARSFKWSWRGWWSDLIMRNAPHWLNWILDSDYREACRESDEDFERELRGTLNLEEKGNDNR